MLEIDLDTESGEYSISEEAEIVAYGTSGHRLSV